jgi:hypothetical protein
MTAAASAQIAPSDTGVGAERGMEQLNTSGEVGTVTLLHRGPNASIVMLNVKSVPHAQMVAIHRAKSCDAIDPGVAYNLGTVSSGGRSSAVVNVPVERLLSGNYSVIVQGTNGGQYVSCGHLY